METDEQRQIWHLPEFLRDYKTRNQIATIAENNYRRII